MFKVEKFSCGNPDCKSCKTPLYKLSTPDKNYAKFITQDELESLYLEIGKFIKEVCYGVSTTT